MKNFKIGVPESSDVVPLTYGFDRHKLIGNAEVIREIPARLSSLESLRAYDLVLMPSIAYARNSSELMVVPECGMVSKGKMGSVRLYFKENLRAIKSVAIAPSAMNEVAMTKIVLAEKYSMSPSFVLGGNALPRMLDSADAALLVGDGALTADKQLNANYLDLGEEWEDVTGMPFVHFIWAARRNSLEIDQLQSVISSRNLGVDNLREIAGEVSAHLDLPFQAVWEHYEKEIYFEIAESEIEGMRQFFELSYYYGLLEYIPSINFFALE
ncbi:MAG: menaquinone biosynthetic enzyme MqnA/MqnD family protein [Candidatus Kryptoniota bacterium]